MHRFFRAALGVALIALYTLPAPAPLSGQGLKVHISVDMEGIAKEALERIAAGVAASLARRSEIEPLIFDSQVTVRIEVADSGQADQVMFVPGMKRVGARLVEYVAPDAVAAYRMSRLVRLLAR